jgi:hypothetical protein
LRACTAKEVAVLAAGEAAAGAGERAEDAELRDARFALLGEGQPDEPGDDDAVPA